MPHHFNTSNHELLAAIRRREAVKLVITGEYSDDGRVLVSNYSILIFRPDDIVSFLAQSSPGQIFLGRVLKVKDVHPYRGRMYDIHCIPRPIQRSGAKDINWLKEATVPRDAILCKWVKGPLLYNIKGKK